MVTFLSRRNSVTNPTLPAQIQKFLLPKFAYGFSFCPLFQVVVYLLIQRRSI